MKAIKILLRPLHNDEKQEIDCLVRELSEVREQHPLSSSVRQLLNAIVKGGFPEPSLPLWTTFIWSEESIHDPRTPVCHAFDVILCNSDLSRLGYFIRTEQGESLKEELKTAWTRVTLAMPESIYSLKDGEECILCFSALGIELCQQYGRDDFQFLTVEQAVMSIKSRLDLMTHLGQETEDGLSNSPII